jgi:hypothetical protein
MQWVGEKMEKMGFFRNIDLNQYNWQIHKFSINKFRKGMRRIYRAKFFISALGSEKIIWWREASRATGHPLGALLNYGFN